MNYSYLCHHSWNSLDLSIIEPYIDENVTWSGGVPHLIKGEYYALVTVDGE